MAIFVRNELFAEGTESSSLTKSAFNSETGVIRGDTVLIVCVGIRDTTDTETISDVTFNSVSLTKAATVTHSVSGTRVISEIWYQVNPSGTADVVFTTSGTVEDLVLRCYVLDGAKEQANEAESTFTDTTSPVGPNSITTLTNGALIIDGISFGDANDTAVVSETDQIIIGDSAPSTNFRLSTSQRQAGDAGSHTMGWTHANMNKSAHVLTAWEDAGAWITNISSAHTQDLNDFTYLQNSGELFDETTPLPSADWERVIRIDDASPTGAFGFPLLADNHSEPSANHIIAAGVFRLSTGKRCRYWRDRRSKQENLFS